MRYGYFLLLVLLMSCTSEPKQAALVVEDTLPGYWTLIHATRNGKTVPSLEGAYFQFDTLGSVSTNFSGQQVLSDLTLSDTAFSYQEKGETKTYSLQIPHKDTLKLSTTIKEIFTFDLTLLRSSSETE